MQQASLKDWIDSSHLAGANAAYIEELYEAYLDDADSVSEEWRAIFANLPTEGSDDVNHTRIRSQVARCSSMLRIWPIARVGLRPLGQTLTQF